MNAVKRSPRTEDELSAAYRDQRATVRPSQCTSGPRCWVELGPLGWGKNKHNNGGCLQCGGIPRPLQPHLAPDE